MSQIEIEKPRKSSIPTREDIKYLEKNGLLKNRKGKKKTTQKPNPTKASKKKTSKSQPSQTPTQDKTEKKPKKPKPESLWQTGLRIIKEAGGQMGRQDLAEAIIAQSKTLRSARPQWVAQSVILNLKKRGLITIERPKRNRKDHKVSLA